MRRDAKFARLLVYAALLLFAAFFLLPFYIVAVTSLKTLDELRRGNMLSLPEASILEPLDKLCEG
jgi:glucose/mannose transport system permease protein